MYRIRACHVRNLQCSNLLFSRGNHRYLSSRIQPEPWTLHDLYLVGYKLREFCHDDILSGARKRVLALTMKNILEDDSSVQTETFFEDRTIKGSETDDSGADVHESYTSDYEKVTSRTCTSRRVAMYIRCCAMLNIQRSHNVHVEALRWVVSRLTKSAEFFSAPKKMLLALGHENEDIVTPQHMIWISTDNALDWGFMSESAKYFIRIAHRLSPANILKVLIAFRKSEMESFDLCSLLADKACIHGDRINAALASQLLFCFLAGLHYRPHPVYSVLVAILIRGISNLSNKALQNLIVVLPKLMVLPRLQRIDLINAIKDTSRKSHQGVLKGIKLSQASIFLREPNMDVEQSIRTDIKQAALGKLSPLAATPECVRNENTQRKITLEALQHTHKQVSCLCEGFHHWKLNEARAQQLASDLRALGRRLPSFRKVLLEVPYSNKEDGTHALAFKLTAGMLKNILLIETKNLTWKGVARTSKSDNHRIKCGVPRQSNFRVHEKAEKHAVELDRALLSVVSELIQFLKVSSQRNAKPFLSELPRKVVLRCASCVSHPSAIRANKTSANEVSNECFRLIETWDPEDLTPIECAGILEMFGSDPKVQLLIQKFQPSWEKLANVLNLSQLYSILRRRTFFAKEEVNFLQALENRVKVIAATEIIPRLRDRVVILNTTPTSSVQLSQDKVQHVSETSDSSLEEKINHLLLILRRLIYLSNRAPVLLKLIGDILSLSISAKVHINDHLLLELIYLLAREHSCKPELLESAVMKLMASRILTTPGNLSKILFSLASASTTKAYFPRLVAELLPRVRIVIENAQLEDIFLLSFAFQTFSVPHQAILNAMCNQAQEIFEQQHEKENIFLGIFHHMHCIENYSPQAPWSSFGYDLLERWIPKSADFGLLFRLPRSLTNICCGAFHSDKKVWEAVSRLLEQVITQLRVHSPLYLVNTEERVRNQVELRVFTPTCLSDSTPSNSEYSVSESSPIMKYTFSDCNQLDEETLFVLICSFSQLCSQSTQGKLKVESPSEKNATKIPHQKKRKSKTDVSKAVDAASSKTSDEYLVEIKSKLIGEISAFVFSILDNSKCVPFILNMKISKLLPVFRALQSILAIRSDVCKANPNILPAYNLTSQEQIVKTMYHKLALVYKDKSQVMDGKQYDKLEECIAAQKEIVTLYPELG